MTIAKAVNGEERRNGPVSGCGATRANGVAWMATAAG